MSNLFFNYFFVIIYTSIKKKRKNSNKLEKAYSMSVLKTSFLIVLCTRKLNNNKNTKRKCLSKLNTQIVIKIKYIHNMSATMCIVVEFYVMPGHFQGSMYLFFTYIP